MPSASSGRYSKRDLLRQRHCKPGQSLKDLLIELYVGQGRTYDDMVDFLSVGPDEERGLPAISITKPTIINYLDYYDIPRREDVPHKAIDSINKSSTLPSDSTPGVFDPTIEGFRCSDQCPFFEVCKYREYVGDKVCPVSDEKKIRFTRPIKAIIRDRYKDDKDLLAHYNNLAELLGSTWEILDRKMTYIKAEDVTQVLNRPDPITGELKKVKVANLLNSEISKDQGTVLKLLDLLKLTPKTADDQGNNEDALGNMVNLVEKAKLERAEQQKHIDEEKDKKSKRKELKTSDDFNEAMEEMVAKKIAEGGEEDDVEGAISINDMMQENNNKD